MAKYIVITGGVISSLGKGITSSSIATLLKHRGYNISIVKIDGYLNVDAGLMSPYEHGEVFVTEDGAETDLDIGNYERFLDINLNGKNNLTTGKIYLSIIRKERQGKYLGKTVQVIPHVTNEVKNQIQEIGKDRDIVVVEIGGVVGDIENEVFIESMRQISLKQKCCFIHLGLVPYLDYIKEVKTKPMQNSVKNLLGKGIKPDILICRTAKKLS